MTPLALVLGLLALGALGIGGYLAYSVLDFGSAWCALLSPKTDAYKETCTREVGIQAAVIAVAALAVAGGLLALAYRAR